MAFWFNIITSVSIWVDFLTDEPQRIVCVLMDTKISFYFFTCLLAAGYGSSGWQAPEQLLHLRQTRAVDLFSLGCLLFFCVTGGKHPYGDSIERDVNIVNDRKDLFLVDTIPEAVDLFTRLLNPNPDLR